MELWVVVGREPIGILHVHRIENSRADAEEYLERVRGVYNHELSVRELDKGDLADYLNRLRYDDVRYG